MIGANCLIIAGEKSGEEHCLSFFEDMRSKTPDTHFWGVGGDLLKEKGMELLYHLRDFSSMGFSEVIGKLPFYYKAFHRILDEVDKRKTKVAILIDFQDFNFRLSKKLKERGVQVLYFVAPQAWAWKEWRASVLGDSIHTLFTLIPFEKQWFSDRGVKRIVGVKHPLLGTYESQVQALIENKQTENISMKYPRIVVLPGSRNSEVKRLLPVYAKTIVELKKQFDITVELVQSPNVRSEYFEPYFHLFDEIHPAERLDTALSNADLALATSGTVTLACALFGVPSVVCYRGSWLNYIIFKLFIKYRGPISLANIIHNERLFPELLQLDANVENISAPIKNWIENRDEYQCLREKLLNTRKLVTGDQISIGTYMADVINKVQEQ